MTHTPQFWLMKCEPSAYSIDDLMRQNRCPWEGVRNYQARNFMRQMKVGDQAFFYHSNADPSGIVGLMKVAKKAYPDSTALDPQSKYYDPKSTPENTRWWMVDVVFIEKFHRVVSLSELRTFPGCEEMWVLRKGQRLSIMPVTPAQFKIIHKERNRCIN